MKYFISRLVLILAIAPTMSHPILNKYMKPHEQDCYISPDFDSNQIYVPKTQSKIAIFNKQGLSKIANLVKPLTTIQLTLEKQEEILQRLWQVGDQKIVADFTENVSQLTIRTIDKVIAYMQEEVFPTIKKIASAQGATQILFIEEKLNNSPVLVDIDDVNLTNAKLLVKHDYMPGYELTDITNLTIRALNA